MVKSCIFWNEVIKVLYLLQGQCLVTLLLGKSTRESQSPVVWSGLSETCFSSYSVVEEETRRSQQAARDKQSPSQANGCSDQRPIDILEMLSRAKDEYERVRLSGCWPGNTKGERASCWSLRDGQSHSRARSSPQFRKGQGLQDQT